jgi:NADH dehydrogenase
MAAEVGADVVLLSVVGASADSPMELFRAKYAAEQHLRASTTGWTIVRATAFAELWAEIMKKPIVFGRGENPINFVAVEDVAAVVERAVIDTDLRGQTLDVGGPANFTFNELAVLLQRIRGRPANVRHVPRPLLRAMAPLARQARAAVALDTLDMTFDPRARQTLAELPSTDIQVALTRAEAESSAAHALSGG